MEIAALQNLGGLGAEQGVRVAYTWEPRGIVRVFLPWLALLALLALKPNRAPGAWWMWVALAGGVALQWAARSSLSFIPSQVLDPLLQAVKAMNFGLAAVWLFSGHLAWKHRFLTFLAIVGITLGFGVGSYLAAESLSGGPELIIGGMLLVAATLVISTALTLAGFVCRKRYSPLSLTLACLVFASALSCVLLLPFFGLALLSNPGRPMLPQFFGTAGFLIIMSLAPLLPYLALSFATGFYRRRLTELLHLGSRETPPVIAPSAPVEMTTAQ